MQIFLQKMETVQGREAVTKQPLAKAKSPRRPPKGARSHTTIVRTGPSPPCHERSASSTFCAAFVLLEGLYGASRHPRRPCRSEALIPVSVSVDVTCVSVGALLDSKQERRGPAFLYEGFDHSPEKDFRHPGVVDKKNLCLLEYTEHRLKKMTAEVRMR
jgi:hypothetical protein